MVGNICFMYCNIVSVLEQLQVVEDMPSYAIIIGQRRRNKSQFT